MGCFLFTFFIKLQSLLLYENTDYLSEHEDKNLGLALTKKYAEINLADIKFISKKDAGTTFTLIFNEEELKKEKA